MKKLVKKILSLIVDVVWPLFFYRSKISTEMAKSNLSQCSIKPSGSGIGKNEVLTPVCDLQIVVPAYNVERFLKECIQSVLVQTTKYSYKIVLVDDGSVDTTSTIADEYLFDSRVIVIHQENRGFSGARNRALKKIFGKYIMFLDSDDMLCDGAIETMLDYAFETDAQIVEGGMLRYDGNIEYKCYCHETNGKFEYSLGMLQGFPCGKIYKAELFSNICFPEGYWYEDSVMSFLIYPQVTASYHVKEYVYKYRVNRKSFTFTNSGKPKCCDTYWILEQLMEDHFKLNLPIDDLYYQKFFRQIILNGKRMASMRKEIQESAFVLSCRLMDKWFEGFIVPKKYKNLYKIIKKRKFIAYRMYCLTH